MRARLAEIFPLVDTNRDMHIDQAEMLAWHEENGALCCSSSLKTCYNLVCTCSSLAHRLPACETGLCHLSSAFFTYVAILGQA